MSLLKQVETLNEEQLKDLLTYCQALLTKKECDKHLEETRKKYNNPLTHNFRTELEQLPDPEQLSEPEDNIPPPEYQLPKKDDIQKRKKSYLGLF